jgi:hypothetical protein
MFYNIPENLEKTDILPYFAHCKPKTIFLPYSTNAEYNSKAEKAH